MMRGKKYTQKKALVNKQERYAAPEAVKLVKETSIASFDAGIDAHVVLGVQKEDRSKLRGAISLPHGTGKSVRVAVFTDNADKKALKTAGAHVVGGQDLIDEVTKGKIDFEIALATPDMMPKLAKVAKQLGTKGLMPNPKDGTVTADPSQKLGEFLKGSTKIKSDPQNSIIHCSIGRQSFDDTQLVENLQALMTYLKGVQPEKIKGNYFQSVYLTSSMGPSVPVEVKSVV